MAAGIAIQSGGSNMLEGRDFHADMTLHLRVQWEPGLHGKPLVGIRHNFLPRAPNVHLFFWLLETQILYGQSAKGFQLWLSVMEPIDYSFCGLFILPGSGAN